MVFMGRIRLPTLSLPSIAGTFLIDGAVDMPLSSIESTLKYYISSELSANNDYPSVRPHSYCHIPMPYTVKRPNVSVADPIPRDGHGLSAIVDQACAISSPSNSVPSVPNRTR